MGCSPSSAPPAPAWPVPWHRSVLGPRLDVGRKRLGPGLLQHKERKEEAVQGEGWIGWEFYQHGVFWNGQEWRWSGVYKEEV